jgi:thiosulfate/3-mercaptopyruvate sulfurtransferase
MRRILLLLAVSALTLVAAEDIAVVQPATLAKDVKSPLIIHVGFSVLYRASHIPGSNYAGPASKPEGIEDLKKAVAGQPKDRQIVLYCGCCPWDKCPNVRPAIAALREMGYKNVKALELPENLKTDWIDKGYPTDRRAQ